MSIFKKSDFIELSEVSYPHCVSIYIRTHRNGSAENQYLDKTALKNELKKAKEDLKLFQLDDTEAEEYLKEATALLDNSDFWKDQSDGLALFIYNNQVNYYLLPAKFKNYTFVSNHLFLKPLSVMLKSEGRHFIMNLSIGNITFYEATQHSITPINIEGLIPQSLEESVGSETEESTIQHHSGNGKGDAIFHGHGKGEGSEKKVELLKLFRDVNNGLMKMINDEDVPLILACVDYLYPIYKEANTYNHLHDQFISGNHDYTEPIELKERSWKIIQPMFDKKKAASLENFDLAQSNGNGSDNLEKIVPAAVAGRISDLFYVANEEVWGLYDSTKHEIRIDDVHKTANTDLVNMAIEETIKHGGEVYKLQKGEMKGANKPMMAVMRY